MELVKAHNLEFEDWNKDNENGDWANICKHHARHIDEYYLDNVGASNDVLCSVNGCQNKSDFYINF